MTARHTSSTTSPVRTTRRPPRSRRPASSPARQSARKAARLGTANPVRSMARSRTNSGSTSSAPDRAARSGGWSCRRRSLVNSTTGTLMAGGSWRWAVGGHRCIRPRGLRRMHPHPATFAFPGGALVCTRPGGQAPTVDMHAHGCTRRGRSGDRKGWRRPRRSVRWSAGLRKLPAGRNAGMRRRRPREV
ncbi:hypothetical protein SCOCK_660024 [Actinacidiphila cocklensis]|uniref:Uncharacterized protein n=1 Tax=Actinacidiphila cocklensis TaxID=887465 RepID=A0A9W4EB43_9ACTN|nr:hypothetical protein SCOCK_660024 [Actinacidiphila cocklensis]